jgi:cytochrome c556
MSDYRKLGLGVLALWTVANAAWTFGLRTHREPEHAATADTGHAAAHATDTAALHPEGAGHTAGPDLRETLTVPAEARDAVLAEMRIMLGAMQGVLEATANGDTAALRAAAHPAGMAMAADPALEALLPPGWMRLAMATHRAFDSLPATGGDRQATVAALARLTGGCNSCHATYRLRSP